MLGSKIVKSSIFDCKSILSNENSYPPKSLGQFSNWCFLDGAAIQSQRNAILKSDSQF